MTGHEALNELVKEGWFKKRSDGWCFAVRPPIPKRLDRYVYLVKTLGAYTVGLHGGPAPLRVTRGGESLDGLLFKWGD